MPVATKTAVQALHFFSYSYIRASIYHNVLFTLKFISILL